MSQSNLDAAGRQRPLKINRLSAKQLYELTNLVKDEYASSGLTDKAFAEMASTKMGFPISDSSVSTARETLGLLSNRDVERASKAASPDTSALAAHILRLEARVLTLETHVRILTTFAQKAGPVAELSGLQFHIGGKADGS